MKKWRVVFEVKEAAIREVMKPGEIRLDEEKERESPRKKMDSQK